MNTKILCEIANCLGSKFTADRFYDAEEAFGFYKYIYMFRKSRNQSWNYSEIVDLCNDIDLLDVLRMYREEEMTLTDIMKGRKSLVINKL